MSDNFYQYADYPTLPEDQKVLWWFDEYLCHDLLLFTTNRKAYEERNTALYQVAILIERHTLYNYTWANNYSSYLFDLLSTRDFNTADLFAEPCQITIPPNSQCVISYLVNSSHTTMLDRMHLEGYAVPPISPIVIGKHQYFCRTEEEPVTVTLGCLKYSVVVNNDTNINILPQFLYRNISAWQNQYNAPSEVIQTYGTAVITASYTFSTSIEGDGVFFTSISQAIEALIDATGLEGNGISYPSSFQGTRGFTPYTIVGSSNSRTIPYDNTIDCQLIYARPSNLFLIEGVSIFANAISSLPSNRSIGTLLANYSLEDRLFTSILGQYFLDARLRPGEQSGGNPKDGLSGNATLFGGNVYNITISFNANSGGPANVWFNEDNYNNKNDFFPFFSSDYAVALINKLLLQTALISPSNSNLRQIVRVNDNGEPIDLDGNVTTNPDEYVYDINYDYIEEYVMGSELMIQEIHACLGAGEFAYYLDGGQPQPYRMNMARLLQTFARAYGVAFKPDGSILAVRERKNIPYDASGATIPDGWPRGQFADNMGGGTTGQTGGATGEERTGISYQNRCNIYENLDDDNKGNDVLKNGDIILCENFLQLFESYLEDLDKGLNWQEMGSGLLPNADGTSYTTFEGMGTLLAELAYTVSALSNNIQQTHVLTMKSYSTTLEILKGLGLPVELGLLGLNLGGDNAAGGQNIAEIAVPMLSDNSVTLHKRLMDVLVNLGILVGGVLKTEDTLPGGTP
jgi:hypothetical protein